jgi:hypothetical protein
MSADFNDPIQSTFAIPQTTIRDGHKHVLHSIFKAYLQPIVERQNLRILVDSCHQNFV